VVGEAVRCAVSNLNSIVAINSCMLGRRDDCENLTTGRVEGEIPSPTKLRYLRQTGVNNPEEGGSDPLSPSPPWHEVPRLSANEVGHAAIDGNPPLLPANSIRQGCPIVLGTPSRYTPHAGKDEIGLPTAAFIVALGGFQTRIRRPDLGIICSS